MRVNHPEPTGSPGPWRLWGPVAVYCGLIFALSSVSSVPALPVGMSDKLAHALLYSGLGLLVARASTGGAPARFSFSLLSAVIAFAAAYGLSDEVHQLFVPSRQFDMNDLAADVLGSALGAGAWWLWGILRRTRHAL